MSRPRRGKDVIEEALWVIGSATTIELLRQAKSIVLPLQYGMSLEQTAQAIGLSKGWTCRLRNPFMAGKTVGGKGKSVRGGRFRPERAERAIKPISVGENEGACMELGRRKRYGGQ
jgi:hypothetical protein